MKGEFFMKKNSNLRKGLAALLTFALFIPTLAFGTNVSAAGSRSKFTLTVTDEVDGSSLTRGRVELQYSAKADASKADREWFTSTVFRLNGKPQSFTIEKDAAEYDFRMNVVSLPHGYKVAEKVMEVRPGATDIHVDRDLEAVEAAVAAAKLNLVMHAYPAVANRIWDIWSYPKPSNVENNPYNDFSYDFGTLFAPYRSNEDRIQLSESFEFSKRRKAYEFAGDSYNIPLVKNIIKNDIKNDLTDKNARENSEGIAKINGLTFNEWYGLRVASPFDSETDNTFKKFEPNYYESHIERNDKFSKYDLNGDGSHSYDENLDIAVVSAEPSNKIHIRGPRLVNRTRTLFTYDVYYITDDTDINKVVAEDFKSNYEDLLDGDVDLDDYEYVLDALDEIENNKEGKAELAETKAELERIKAELEAKREAERVEEAKERATELVEKAEETLAAEDIRLAKDAVDALPDSPEKAELDARINAVIQGKAEAEDFKKKHQTILEKPSDTIEASDLAAIEAALADYDNLSDIAKKILAPEKVKLDKDLATAKEKKIQAEVDGFKTANNAALTLDPNNIKGSDLTAIEKALADYENLSPEAKGRLANEKAALDAAKVKAEAAKNADSFKEKHKEAIGLNPATVTKEDLEKVKAALADYDNLSAEEKALVEAEKAKLDSLKEKIENLPEENVGANNQEDDEADQATKDADAFKKKHKDTLALTADTVKFSDLAAIEAALADYDNLSAEAKDKLPGVKEKLEELKKAAKEAKELSNSESAEDLAKAFKVRHNQILKQTPEKASETDLPAIEKALADYEKQPAEVKTLLASEKAHLDNLKNKVLSEKPDDGKIYYTTITYTYNNTEIAKEIVETKGSEKVVPHIPSGYEATSNNYIVPGSEVTIALRKKATTKPTEVKPSDNSKLTAAVEKIANAISNAAKPTETKTKDKAPSTGAARFGCFYL